MPELDADAGSCMLIPLARSGDQASDCRLFGRALLNTPAKVSMCPSPPGLTVALRVPDAVA